MTRNFTLLLLLAVSSAFGQLLDPATLHIGTGVGTFCAPGCPGVTNHEVTAVGGTFDIFQEANNPEVFLPATEELLLIAAVPNTVSTTITSGMVSAAKEYDPYTAATGTTETINVGQTPTVYGSSPDTYGNTFSTAALSEGSIVSGQDVFTELGPSISAADNSESFGNFNQAYAAEVAAGTTGFSGVPTSYSIYVWSISSTAFTGNSAMNITSTLPVGTFLTAFGEGTDPKNMNVKIFSTQFTNTGLITTQTTTPTTTPTVSPTITPSNVPEPSSIALLGSVVIGVCSLLRKKLRRV